MAATPTSILIIDDDAEIRYSLGRVLSSRGYTVTNAASGEEGIAAVRKSPPALIFLDIRLGGMGGIETLQHIRSVNPKQLVVLMTAFGTAQTAIEAMKFGAFDYLMKPFDPQKVLALADHALTTYAAMRAAGEYRPTVNTEDYQEGIVGSSPAMQEVFKTMGQVTASDVTVMITGESGTGKELVARGICQHSHRATKPFVAVNCAAIPDNLIESELFGHEKGAFTGAIRQKPGRFELADAGTILLDEVDDIPVELQVKLLRVVEQQEFERVGGETPVHVDVRLICATKCDLLKLVREGRFREDLYYRLNVIDLNIPPLRERPDDIPVLAQHFAGKHAILAGDQPVTITPQALDELMRHKWPGNARELEHVVERALAFCGGDEIRPEHVLPLGTESSEPTAVWAGVEPVDNGPLSLSDTLADIERRMILLALRQCEHNQVRAAQRLGIPRTTLRDKMAKYKIPGG
jgi:DNA-binding NtrC family response regulator